MTKSFSLLAALVLSMQISGCGKSGSQQEPTQGRQADDTSRLCASIEGTGLAKQCAANSRYRTVGVTIDSNDDETGRNACADIASKLAQLASHDSGHWTLQVYSPYRSDKPLASCPLY